MSLYKASESPYKDEGWIKSGLPALDYAIGEGIPRGRITEICGNKSTGKTTMAMTMIRQAQEAGLSVIFCDAENALSFRYAEKLGVDLDKLQIVHAVAGEEYLDEIEAAVSAGKVDLVIVDSVDALVPRAMIEGSNDQQFMGSKARMLGKFLRRVIFPLKKHQVALVLLNQFRMNIMTGQQETPGGMALHYYTSVQVKLRQVSVLKQGENTVGIKVAGRISKNKVGNPYGEFESSLLFGQGFSESADVIDVAIKGGVITKQGNTLYFGELKLGVGLPKTRAYLEANPTVYEEIKGKL